MVTKINYNTAGVQVNAEAITVPASPGPYLVRLAHHFIESGSVEVWTDNAKEGTQLTEEAYDGSPSADGYFQVDYAGAEDGDILYKNALIFHSAQAEATLYVWYQSLGDLLDVDAYDLKADKDADATEGNLAKFDANGNPVDSGNTLATTRKIIIRAASFKPPTTNGAAIATIDGTYFTYQTLDFDKDTDELADVVFIMPDDYDGGNITVTFYWIANATTGDVVWTISVSGRADTANIGEVALESAQSKTDTTDGTANDLNISAFSAFDPGAGVAGGTLVAVRVTRDANNESDTLAVDARLILVEIDYTGR